VFRPDSEDGLIPISDLLSLRESSLALVPTLTTTPKPSTRIEAPVPAAPIVGVRFSGSVSTAVQTSDTFVISPADGNYHPERGAHNDAVALNTFLDLHAFQSIPQKAGAQLPGISLHAVGARDSPSADRDAEAEGLLSQAAVEELEAP